MPEIKPESQIEPTDFEKLADKIDMLIQLQARTNDLLAKVINNNITHFNSLNNLQSANTHKTISVLNASRQDLTRLHVAIDAIPSWLEVVNTNLQASENTLNLILNKNIEVALPQNENDTLLQQILDVLRLGLDEGAMDDKSGTATTTTTVIDLLKTEPYHTVKGYTIKNDGTTTIYVAINDSSKLYELRAKESDAITHNTPDISKIFVKTDSGTTDYRLRVLW